MDENTTRRYNSETSVQLAEGLKVTWVGLFANLFLIVIKLIGGIVGRSQALIADAVHSISDIFSDIVVLFGLKWGRKEDDEEHHWGHARIETISSLIVGFLLFLVALGIAYNADSTASVTKIVRRPPTSYSTAPTSGPSAGTKTRIPLMML